MTHLTFAWASLMAAQALAGAPPEPPNRPPLDSVIALRTQFRDIHSAPVSTYATASLAMRVCPFDKTAGESLFADAIRELNSLPESSFVDASEILPVTSFAALYRFVAIGAKRCEPKLLSHLAIDSIHTRIERARQNAAADLSAAKGLADTNPDRAAQLTAAALSASDPEDFDIRTMVSILCTLRERAPDLADDLFEQALAFEAEVQTPNPGVFDELARYVFIARQMRELPNTDTHGRARSYEVAGSTFTDLTDTRHSSNPESVLAFLTTVATVLKDTKAGTAAPVVAYALAYQLLPKARELAPDLTSTFENALDSLAAIAANYTGQIIAALSAGGGQVSVDAEIDPDRKRDRFVAKALAAWKAKQFDTAKDAVHPIDGLSICSQIDSLIDFGRATVAVEHKDIGAALGFASRLKQGVKRAILYAAIAAAEKDRDAGLDIIKLAIRDAEVLPAEFRASVLMAITKILMRMDKDWGYASLNRAVAAFNAASLRPRQTVFDPRKARRSFTVEVDASTDAPFILHTRKGFYEVVDTEYSRHNFPLKAPALENFDLQPILASVDDADAEKLCGIALEIRNDTKRVSALLGIADLMLRRVREAEKEERTTQPESREKK